MANLSEEFQRRQLPSLSDREDLYPVRVSQSVIRNEQQKISQSAGGSFEESDWRERLTESLPDWPANME